MSTADVERNPAPALDGADVQLICLVAGLRSRCYSVVVAGRALTAPPVMALDIDPEGSLRLLKRRRMRMILRHIPPINDKKIRSAAERI